jgi:hypothetical protein
VTVAWSGLGNEKKKKSNRNPTKSTTLNVLELVKKNTNIDY